MHRTRWVMVGVALVVVVGVVAWLLNGGSGGRASGAQKLEAGAFPNVIVPAPVTAVASGGRPFVIDRATTVASDSPAVADYLTGVLRRSTGFELKTSAKATRNSIALSLHGAPSSVGSEGYQLVTDDRGVSIHATTPAGL